jgi:hypothetical protein
MIKPEETHLTKRQFEVLKLKMEGRSLTEIAEKFGTSRSNISRIARIAEENVKKARNTLKLIQTIEWPIRVNVRMGANVYQVSEKVFKRADEKGIKISYNYPEFVRLITETLGRKGIRRRKVLRSFTIAVSSQGRIEIT